MEATVSFFGALPFAMQRSTLCIVILSQTCFQARASPLPRNLRSLKDSPSGCLTVIFFLALLLTILFIFKKIYVARRRNIVDPVSKLCDGFSEACNRRSMAEPMANKSGFYVGLLGSPGWETKHSVFIPGHLSLPPKGRTPSCCRVPSGPFTTTILHKMPSRCKIISTRPAYKNVFGDKLQPLNIAILTPELSRPPPAMVSLKRPSPCLDTKFSLRTRCLSSPLIIPNDQHGDFQSNENITFNSGPRNLVLVSSFNSRTDHSDFKDERRSSGTYDSDAVDIKIPSSTSTKRIDLLENGIRHSTIKPLHFDSISKRRPRVISDSSQQLYGDKANDSTLQTAAQDLSVVCPLTASHKIPDSSKFCPSVDLTSNAVRFKPQCSPTKRTKNSPIIGPSPLRTMSLPLDYDLECTEKLNFNNLSKIQSEAKFDSPIPKRSKLVLQADGPDIIFDLIRELAQETRSWDASLFVDENFKAMMDQSETHPSCKLQIQIPQEKRSKYRRKQRRATPFIPLQDIPESDVPIVFFEEDVNPDEAQSFWDDEINFVYQHDAQPQPPSLGVDPCSSLTRSESAGSHIYHL